jgi:hypothetical protein
MILNGAMRHREICPQATVLLAVTSREEHELMPLAVMGLKTKFRKTRSQPDLFGASENTDLMMYKRAIGGAGEPQRENPPGPEWLYEFYGMCVEAISLDEPGCRHMYYNRQGFPEGGSRAKMQQRDSPRTRSVQAQRDSAYRSSARETVPRRFVPQIPQQRDITAQV